MKAATTVITVLFVAILKVDVVFSAPVYVSNFSFSYHTFRLAYLHLTARQFYCRLFRCFLGYQACTCRSTLCGLTPAQISEISNVLTSFQALVDAYAPPGAVPGQPPGVVPVKRDAELVEKSDELEDCAAPCDFYIHRSVDTEVSEPLWLSSRPAFYYQHRTKLFTGAGGCLCSCRRH